ncbi:hypothetical protein EON65_57495 [archaeon]|nr:MAG: hypothetical protein EON65_57495 [archaeon]
MQSIQYSIVLLRLSWLMLSPIFLSYRAKLADAVVPPNLAISPPTNPNAKELWFGSLSSQSAQPTGTDTHVEGHAVDKIVALESSIKSSVVRFKNSEDDGQR